MSQEGKGNRTPASFDRLMGSVKLSKATKKVYLMRVKQYLRLVGEEPDDLVKKARARPKRFEESFIEFIQKTSKESSATTTTAFRDSVKRFLELNRVNNVNWDYINEFVPTARKSGRDRAPTTEEVRKIVDVADLRTKCLVLFLCSSGARIGSVPYLRWRDIDAIESGNQKLAKVMIYGGEPEAYLTFVTPECYRYLQEYRQWREGIGEKVTEASNVFATQGNATKFDPSRIRSASVKTLQNQLARLQQNLGMRSVLSERDGYKNYQFKQVHGFRKFFKTRMEVAGVKPLVIETLMGHATGVSKSYFKPTDDELAQEYAKAIEGLTIVEKTGAKVDIKNAFREQLLLVAGFKEEEVKQLDLSKVTDEELQRTIREKLLGMVNNGVKQKVVANDDVEGHLTRGWEYVATLPGERAVDLPSQEKLVIPRPRLILLRGLHQVGHKRPRRRA